MSPLVWFLSCLLVGIVFIINMSSGVVQQPVADHNGQPREMSVYEQYCCQYSNREKSFIVETESTVQVIFCPNKHPQSCPPPADCTEVLSANPQATSGFYKIRSNAGSETVSVYCDMEGVNCDGEGGWTRVAYLNMTQQNATCPSGLYQQDYDNINHPVCGRNTSLSSGGCATHVYSTLGIEYSKVCGRVRGYQKGVPENLLNLVDAISIWLNSATHVWTFIAQAVDFHCVCTDSFATVENNYFCESGHSGSIATPSQLYHDDPLWDGKQCTGSDASTGCCSVSNIPWFIRSFNSSLSIGDLRFSICLDRGYDFEDIPVDMIEIFVK